MFLLRNVRSWTTIAFLKLTKSFYVTIMLVVKSEETWDKLTSYPFYYFCTTIHCQVWNFQESQLLPANRSQWKDGIPNRGMLGWKLWAGKGDGKRKVEEVPGQIKTYCITKAPTGSPTHTPPSSASKDSCWSRSAHCFSTSGKSRQFWPERAEGTRSAADKVLDIQISKIKETDFFIYFVGKQKYLWAGKRKY